MFGSYKFHSIFKDGYPSDTNIEKTNFVFLAQTYGKTSPGDIIVQIIIKKNCTAIQCFNLLLTHTK